MSCGHWHQGCKIPAGTVAGIHYLDGQTDFADSPGNVEPDLSPELPKKLWEDMHHGEIYYSVYYYYTNQGPSLNSVVHRKGVRGVHHLR